MKTVHSSGNLGQLTGNELKPNFLLEADNRVYLNNPAIGVLVFDIYGTYIKTIPIKELNSFQISDDEMVYFKNGELHSYQLKTLTEKNILLPASDSSASILSARIERSKLYLLNKQNLSLYSF
jgi:hypothetical protein